MKATIHRKSISRFFLLLRNSFLFLFFTGSFIQVKAQTDFDLSGNWNIEGKNICATFKKSGKDYKVRDCEDTAYKSKYVRVSTNRYKKNNFIFFAKDEDHLVFIEGSDEKWTRLKKETKSGEEVTGGLPPILSIEEIVLSQDRLVAGQTAQLKLTVKNAGDGNAEGVYAVLSSATKGLEFVQKTNLKLIPKKGGKETVSIELDGGLNLGNGEAVLKIEVVDPKFKVKIQSKQVKFSTKEFAKPDLLLAKFAVIENLSSNPNNQIDLNEQIDVMFIVQNVGSGNAENVKFTVANDQKGVVFLGVVDKSGTLIRKEVELPMIASGKHETIAYRYFVNSEFQSSKLTFSITAREKHGKFGLSQARSVEINKTLKEEGYIRTVESKPEEKSKPVIIEDVPDLVADIDEGIPVTGRNNDKTFAVVIGNEKYLNEAKVKYALNDAYVFRKYLENTLGLPQKNIRYVTNATYGQMLDALKWISDVAKAYNGEAKLIFYYAGHGMPDEETKSSFLLPADGNSQNIVTAIKVADVYARLNEFPTQSVNVFMDACFSGSSREENGAMLAKGRGVKIKPKGDAVTGKMIVMSASTGDETAFPFNEKKHGMFTYFLLKKLKESKGTASMGELSEYVITNVSQQSVLINKKPQTPQITPSQELLENWKIMGF